MILKASTVSSRPHAGKLAAHLLQTDENERAAVVDVRGIGERPELADTLRTMLDSAAATKGRTGLFHVSINPRSTEAQEMGQGAWESATAAIEREFNLADQPRVLVEHEKGGRRHIHAVYQVADVERGRQCDPQGFSHYRHRCQRIGRELEQELGHELTATTPPRGYTRDEQQQAKRYGENVSERRAALRSAWDSSGTAEAFRAKVRALGYDVAKGDRAAFVLVMQDGSPARLSAELRGAATGREIRQRFEGVGLDSVAETTATQRFSRANRSITGPDPERAAQEAERQRQREEIERQLREQMERRRQLGGPQR